MILSYQIPEFNTYRTAALALYDIERDIACRKNSKNAIDRKILPRLIEKRDRMAAEVAPLKAAADAAEQAARERATAPSTAPASSRPRAPTTGDPLDIPTFLRRAHS